MGIGAATTVNKDVNVLERIRSLSPSLTRSTRRVGEFVLADPGAVVWMSAAQVASRTGSSVGTVVRFCEAIGCRGFQDMKLQLSSALPATPMREDMPHLRPSQGPIETVLESTLKGIATTYSSVDYGAIQKAAATLHSATRILVPAAGPSQPLAMALGQWLSRTGRVVSHPTDPETQLAVAKTLGDDAACFAISHSGTTEHTLRPTQAAAERGAKPLALTSFHHTPLTELCDVSIVAGVPATPFHDADTASRPTHLAVLYALTAEMSHLDGQPMTAVV